MFLPFDTMTLHHDSGNRHDFPRLARESGFSFNLYRGRVDWSKIGSIDIDKIVRERDLETLQDLLSCVMSCNLSSEYDLKILDPNFLKIFQLAQLATDFLLYCRNYLDHCVTVMQEQLRVTLQEIEHLRQLKLQNSEEIRSLEKKLKAKSKRVSLPNSSPVPVFKCCQCEKRFLGEHYLMAHQQRRHSELFSKEVATKIDSHEVKDLQKQVQELQDRLRFTEVALKEKQGFLTPQVTVLQRAQENELQEKSVTNVLNPNLTPQSQHTSPKEVQSHLLSENPVTVEPLDSTVAKVDDQDEAPSSRQSIEYLKQKYAASEAAFLSQAEMLNGEIKSLREQLHQQHKAYEITTQRKLEELQRQHQADLDELRLSIQSKNRGSGDHIVALSGTSNVKVIGDLPVPSSNQVNVQKWNEDFSPSNAQMVKESFESVIPSQLAKESAVIELSRTGSSVSSGCETKSIPPQQHRLHHEDYVSPSDQESSDTSSQSFSPVPVIPAIKNSGERVPEISRSKKNDLEDTSNNSKTMYGKSSSDSASETGSSSFDSDSQSMSSEQQPYASGLDEHHSRLKLTPQVFDGLKEDLLGLLNRRLRELGVDPEWNKLPVASFHSNLATVKHHQNIAAKNHQSYFQIQEALIKEVDQRVAKNLKLHQPAQKSTETKKKRLNGSFSLFARIKSHVKNRLSNSGHSSLTLKQSHKSDSKTGDPVENVYSQEPSTSKSSHEYEILQENPSVSLATVTESCSPSTGQRSNSEGKQVLSSILSFSKPPVSNSTEVSSENIIASSKTGAVDIKVYSRSMYANLNKYDIEVESKNLVEDSADKPPAQLQTSTPIKSPVSSTSPRERKPSFISSDIESISEVEADANDKENVSGGVTEHQKPNKHTTMTTAELLANVAKFRQSNGQGSASHSIVKSNLKSSLSTGNIMKKKVVFQDEKAGFNTLELGPAHSSFESLTPQRSLSENSVSTYPIGPAHSARPVPQPRSSVLPVPHSPNLSAANNDSDGDWDWDKDSSDNTLTSKEVMTVGHTSPEKFSLSGTNWRPIFGKQPNSEASDVSGVSSIVSDLERKLQANIEKPVLGPTLPVAQPSASPLTRSFTGTSGINSFGELDGSAIRSHASMKNDDNLSDLLLDDLSSS